MSQHKPGPWSFEDEGEGNEYYARFIRLHGPRGLIFVDEDEGPGPEDLANARLIAAAPDLLEACRKVLGTFGKEKLFRPTMSPREVERFEAILMASAAIAKAEGRTQPEDRR